MLSPNARLAQLLELVARTLETRLPREVPNWREVIPEKSCLYQKDKGVLDAHACLKILGVAKVFDEPMKGRRHAIGELTDIRNRWAHQEAISHHDVERAIIAISDIMQALGERVASEAATLLRSQNFEYSESVRKMLEKQAKAGCEIITYEEACRRLKLSNTQDRNQLYRQLTALGILQKANGEPQLCSLVVLGTHDPGVSDEFPAGVPGRGFYWLIGLDARAPLNERRKRWLFEIEALKNTWISRVV